MTPSAIPALAGRRLLVVEDEFFVAEHIAMLLADFGCDVVGPVGTVEEALDVVAEGGLDGALLDANLNGTSSAPIAAALQNESIPFVVITGYGALKIDDDVLDCAPRLIKPFSTADFGATLVAAFPSC